MKFKFYFKRPSLIVVNNDLVKKLLFQTSCFRFLEKSIPFFKKMVLLLKPLKKNKFFLKYSKLPILVLENESQELKKFLPPKGYLILNYDKERSKKEILANIFTYGFLEGSDFLITDVNYLEEQVNFKINYQGSIIPFWVKGIKEKKQLYSAVVTIVVLFCLGLNLVEISKSLQIDKE